MVEIGVKMKDLFRNSYKIQCYIVEAKKLIETRDSKYILESTSILSKYYKIDNIEDIYNSQKANRLKYEL